MSPRQIVQNLWYEQRGKLILLAVLLLLLVALQLWQALGLEPQVERLRHNLQARQDDLRKEQQRIAEGGGARISSIADDLEHFYQMVPSRAGLGSFIGRLYGYASDSGIDIDQINYSAEPVKGAGLLAYQLQFSVGGSYAQIKKFINRLETSPSLLIVSKISLNGKQAKSASSVSLQMELRTFFREEEK